jgi:hypothetical protein
MVYFILVTSCKDLWLNLLVVIAHIYVNNFNLVSQPTSVIYQTLKIKLV